MRRNIDKILIANRSEIAIRILRAASELGIRTVSVYTHEDRFSPHRYKSDEAYQIGEDDEPLKPYLDIDAIIEVARLNDVDAIHPGYGFLSENVEFASRCREEGVIFIGPTPEAMAMLESHSWPGNVRELQNAVERALLLGGATLESEDIGQTLSHSPLPDNLWPAGNQPTGCLDRTL